METNHIISIISISLTYITGIVIFWINIKVKLNELDLKMKELDLKIQENKSTIDDHKKWGNRVLEKERDIRNSKFKDINEDIDKLKLDNYNSHKDILNKMDLFLSNFADFRVYVESQFNKKS